ncbi:helix-turn-helix transcriptional regulator [Mycoplasmatota bacterium WC44]
MDTLNIKSTGLVIKMNRIEESMSVRFLADLIPISPTYLSNIENGLMTPRKEILERIFKVLDIEFDLSDKLISEVKLKFDEIYQNVVRFNLSEIEEGLKFLKFKEKWIKNSPALLDYQLIRYVYFVSEIDPNEYEETRKLEEDLRQVVKQMTGKQAQLFYQYYGVRLTTDNNLKEALESFNKSQKYQSEINQGMMDFHLGILYSKLNKSYESIEYTNNARLFFEKEMNYRRALYCRVNLADEYSRLKMYKLAEKFYRQIISISHDLKMKDIESTGYESIAWIKLLQKDYFEVSSCTNKSRKINGSYSSKGLLCLAWMNYKNGDTMRSFDYIQKGLELEESVFYMNLFNILKCDIVDDGALDKEKLIIEAINYTKTKNELEHYEFIVNIYIEFLSNKNKYKKAFEYSQELISMQSERG